VATLPRAAVSRARPSLNLPFLSVWQARLCLPCTVDAVYSRPCVTSALICFPPVTARGGAHDVRTGQTSPALDPHTLLACRDNRRAVRKPPRQRSYKQGKAASPRASIQSWGGELFGGSIVSRLVGRHGGLLRFLSGSNCNIQAPTYRCGLKGLAREPVGPLQQIGDSGYLNRGFLVGPPARRRH
jgi:hypothetical protein